MANTSQRGSTMSLTTFVEQDEVAARLRAFVPDVPRTFSIPVKVQPRTTDYSGVGTAFDYFLRFEILRRAPHAQARPWVAEGALEYLKKARLIGISRSETMFVDHSMVEQVRKVVEAARSAVSHFVTKRKVSRKQREEVASHALRLARLDLVVRRRVLDPARLEEVDDGEVEELLALLGIVPFQALVDERVMLLNPAFGESSRLVGGADADLISGGTLIDIKTKKAAAWTLQDFNQLLGYLILGRNERRSKRAFPALVRVGIYFSRHGYLWVYDVASVVRSRAFREAEEWFIKRANAQSAAISRRGQRRTLTMGAASPAHPPRRRGRGGRRQDRGALRGPDDLVAVLDEPVMELEGGVDALALADLADFLVLVGPGRTLVELPLDHALDVLAELAALVLGVAGNGHGVPPF